MRRHVEYKCEQLKGVFGNGRNGEEREVTVTIT